MYVGRRTLQCKAYTQKALHKFRVVAYRNILLNLFKLSFLLGRTQSHMVLIFLINKSESFFWTNENNCSFLIVLKQKEHFKLVQQTSECVSLFGSETCDTSKLRKRWLVGRWMEPTHASVLRSNLFLLFQIIVKQKEPDHRSFWINIKWKGTFSSKRNPLAKFGI